MDKFIRKQNTKEKDNLIFQILSWEAFDDEIIPEDCDSSDTEEPVQDIRYHIYAFGVDEAGDSVCVRFENYKPYFFAYIPDNLQNSFDDYKKKEVERFIRNKLFKSKEDLESVSIVKRKKYNGFTNEKEYKFLRFVCKNFITFNRIKYILNPKDKSRLPKISNIDPINKLKFDLYESNIEPYIRFTHKMNIPMAGWVSVDKITRDKTFALAKPGIIVAKSKTNSVGEWLIIPKLE